MAADSNWTSFAESPYPWERDALDRVDQFCDFDPLTHYTLTLAETELTFWNARQPTLTA